MTQRPTKRDDQRISPDDAPVVSRTVERRLTIQVGLDDHTQCGIQPVKVSFDPVQFKKDLDKSAQLYNFTFMAVAITACTMEWDIYTKAYPKILFWLKSVQATPDELPVVFLVQIFTAMVEAITRLVKDLEDA